MKKLLDLLKSSIFYGPSKFEKSHLKGSHFGSSPSNGRIGASSCHDVERRTSGVDKVHTVRIWSTVVVQKMPKRCIAAGCSNVRNLKEDISLHKLPFYNDDRTEAKKRRKKWVDFVRLKRAKWQPSQSSVLCSEHLKA